MEKIVKLSESELETLKGGEEPAKNKNTIDNCICFFNDTQLVENINSAYVCSCECIKP